MDKHILLRDLSGLKSFVIAMTPDNEQEQIAKLLEAMERIRDSIAPITLPPLNEWEREYYRVDSKWARKVTIEEAFIAFWEMVRETEEMKNKCVSEIEKNWMVHDNTEYPSADISGDYK